MRKGDAAGPIQKPTGLYYLLRIKKRSLFKLAIDDRWVKIGDYASKDKALEALEDEVEIMKTIENEDIPTTS